MKETREQHGNNRGVTASHNAYIYIVYVHEWTRTALGRAQTGAVQTTRTWTKRNSHAWSHSSKAAGANTAGSRRMYLLLALYARQTNERTIRSPCTLVCRPSERTNERTNTNGRMDR